MKIINKDLTEEEINIISNKGTEPPFTGKLLKNREKGIYLCKNCGTELFTSVDKFDSGSGWPSFDKGKNVLLKEDNALGLKRTEVVCEKCKAHLGHLFKDGPTETKNRFCINSLSLIFKNN